MVGRRVSYISFLVIVATIATAAVTVNGECRQGHNVLEQFLSGNCGEATPARPDAPDSERRALKMIKKHTYTFSFAPEESAQPLHAFSANPGEDNRDEILRRNRILLE